MDRDDLKEFRNLKAAYLDYFSKVGEDRVGGNGKIRHIKACLELVKEGKLVRTKSGGFKLATKE